VHRGQCAPDSCLLAPADDRNALATTAGGIVPSPAGPASGEGRYMPKTPCLFAPADDRNGLATPTAEGNALAG
jgi:hypothetical protein